MQNLEEFLEMVRVKIITEIFNDKDLKFKIIGMCYRNHIPQDTKIEEDVLQEIMFYISKYDRHKLIQTWCDNPKRVLALAITIAIRHGFGKMNNGQHPNQSLAKKILWTSNIKSKDMINGDGEIENEDRISKPIVEKKEEVDIWNIIKENLTEDERSFLKFVLDNIYSKKRIFYGRELRKKMSYNEYKINLLMLKNRIREIVKKNKINGYGKTFII